MVRRPGPALPLKWTIPAGAFLAGCLLSFWMQSLSPISTAPCKGGGPSRGEPPRPYRRVVCLSPALVEILFDMGAGDRVVGGPDFLFWPPRARSLPRVGGSFNPAFEKILTLKPGFLLFQGQSAKVRDFARRHGIPFPDPPLRLDTLEDLFSAYWRLGLLFGIPEKAEAAAHRLRAALARTAERAARAEERTPVLLALGHREGTLAGIYTATRKTFLGEIARIAGGDNVFADAPGMWPQVSLESVQARRPRVILDFHPGEKVRAASLLADWKKGLPGLPAVRDGRVYILAQNFLLLPGPRAARTAEILAGLLHPSPGKEKSRHDPGRARRSGK